MREWIQYWKSIKLTNYWHAEVIFIVPLTVYGIWRIETIVHLLRIIAGV